MFCNVSFAEKYIDCDVNELKNPHIKQLFKYITYDDDVFGLFYLDDSQSNIVGKRFLLDIPIDKEFSSKEYFESDIFDVQGEGAFYDVETQKKVSFIRLDKSTNSLSVYDKLKKRQFLFQCKEISKKAFKKLK